MTLAHRIQKKKRGRAWRRDLLSRSRSAFRCLVLLFSAHPWCIADRSLGPQTPPNTHTQSERAEPLSHSSVSLCNRRLQMLWGWCLFFRARSVCVCVCACLWAVVYIVALMPILLRSLAGAAGQNPNKRLLWCLRRLPVQNTVVPQRPIEERWLCAERASRKADDIYQAIECRILAPSAQVCSEMEYWFRSVP